MRRRLSSPTSLVLFAGLILLCPSLEAQIGGSEMSTTRGPVGVRGGQRTYSIAGRVVDDSTNQPVFGARVAVTMFSGMFVQEAYVDTQGTFSFSDLSRGTYYVRVSHRDYEDAEETAQIASAPIMGLVIYLHPRVREVMPVLLESLDVNQQQIPKDARKEFEKGVDKYNQKKLDEALAHFRAATELFPNYVSSLHAQGVIHLRLVEINEARSCFERAVELNPNVASPRVLLGGIYNADHRYREAEQHLLKAIQLNPKSGLAYFELARAYWGLGDVEKWDQTSLRAHELVPSIPQVHLVRANALLARQDYAEALKELDEFLKMVPTGQLADHVRQKRTQLQEQLARVVKP